MQSESEKTVLKKLESLVDECRELDKYKELIDDKFLLHFVRGRKNNLAKAYETLKNYFNFRKSCSSFFKSIDPKKVPMIENGIIRILRHRDPEGRAFVFVDFGKWNPNELKSDELFIAYILIVEELWNLQSVEVNGISIIAEVSEFSLKHLALFPPSQMKKFVNLSWSSFPIRFRAVYLLNSTWIINFALKIFKSILPIKLRERLHIWGTNEMSSNKLYDIIEADKLPHSLRPLNPPNDDSYINDKPECQDPDSLLDYDEAIWDVDLESNIKLKEEYYKNLARLL